MDEFKKFLNDISSGNAELDIEFLPDFYDAYSAQKGASMLANYLLTNFSELFS